MEGKDIKYFVCPTCGLITEYFDGDEPKCKAEQKIVNNLVLKKEKNILEKHRWEEEGGKPESD